MKTFLSDDEALTVLERGGFRVHPGVGVIEKHRNGDADEEAAIRYLCSEWDYAWEHCHPHNGEDPAMPESEGVPYDEDAMPHLGDRENLSTQL